MRSRLELDRWLDGISTHRMLELLTDKKYSATGDNLDAKVSTAGSATDSKPAPLKYIRDWLRLKP
jgi:hypothetical protein